MRLQNYSSHEKRNLSFHLLYPLYFLTLLLSQSLCSPNSFCSSNPFAFLTFIQLLYLLSLFHPPYFAPASPKLPVALDSSTLMHLWQKNSAIGLLQHRDFGNVYKVNTWFERHFWCYKIAIGNYLKPIFITYTESRFRSHTFVHQLIPPPYKASYFTKNFLKR